MTTAPPSKTETQVNSPRIPTREVTSPPLENPTTMQRFVTTERHYIPTTPLGCFENGKFYPAGSKMSDGYDESEDWCFGSYCDERGFVLNWDTWNCKGRYTSTAPPLPTTIPFPPSTPEPPVQTTEPSTTNAPWSEPTSTREPTTDSVFNHSEPIKVIKVCHFDGQLFEAGSQISEGYDNATDWCYGQYCNDDGYVVNWDRWNCKKEHFTTARMLT